MQHLHFIPIHSEIRLEKFDLTSAVLECVEREGETIQQGDIVLISSKFAAIAKGRVAKLDVVEPSQKAIYFSEKYGIQPPIAELIIRESDHIFGGIPGFLLTVKDNIIAPNAGIDSSNIPADRVVLYPEKPFELAVQVSREIKGERGVDAGVVLTDSRLMPGRTGTTGVAIGVAGFVPVVDERGRLDLLGRPLKVSQRAVADNLCAGAQLLMGESNEGIPIVIARNTGIEMTGDRPYSWRDLAIDWQLDIYVAIMGGK